jgi:RecJ-like exonuclease
MVEYCEICGEELDENEEKEGICRKCKKEKGEDEEYEKDEDFIDPGIT